MLFFTGMPFWSHLPPPFFFFSFFPFPLFPCVNFRRQEMVQGMGQAKEAPNICLHPWGFSLLFLFFPPPLFPLLFFHVPMAMTAMLRSFVPCSASDVLIPPFPSFSFFFSPDTGSIWGRIIWGICTWDAVSFLAFLFFFFLPL